MYVALIKDWDTNKTPPICDVISQNWQHVPPLTVDENDTAVRNQMKEVTVITFSHPCRKLYNKIHIIY